MREGKFRLQPTQKPRIKICCISSINEAQLAIQHGASAPGNRSLAIKELGGTGRTHDWTISKKIREAVDIPIFLAGGPNADNVVEAITQVQPFGIDLCSGVRTNGFLDERKLARFFKQVYSVAETYNTVSK